MGKFTVASVKAAKAGRHSDGQGLALWVKPTGARSWVLRIQVNGRRRDVGLGPFPQVGLAEARDRAADLRKAARQGRDPVSERDRDKGQPPTFRQAAERYHETMKGSWSRRQGETFLSSLQRHAFPRLGDLRVDLITSSDIRAMLAPIWTVYTDMSRKVRGRVVAVLNFAHANDWRESEAPSRSITMGLPKRRPGGHYLEMPYRELPDFVRELDSKPTTIGRFALHFVILTAARTGEVRHAKWSQIDSANRLWNRPGECMKNGIAHSITLNSAAMAILKRIDQYRTSQEDGLIFPGASGKPMSDMTLTKILRDAGIKYHVHGFRASFRDWVAEQMPLVPDPVAEAALSHRVADAVVRAYKRTNFLDMRHGLLEDWSRFIDSGVTHLASQTDA